MVDGLPVKQELDECPLQLGSGTPEYGEAATGDFGRRLKVNQSQSFYNLHVILERIPGCGLFAPFPDYRVGCLVFPDRATRIGRIWDT